MGREIKFRAKRKDDVWVYGSLVVGTDGETMYIFTSEGAQWSVFSETVGQYTGLKDKNGRETYEGDLLKDDAGIGEVEWVQEHCAFMIFAREPSFYYHLECDGQLKVSEVVGNIYENPELIEV
ncbi:hypothetical protein BSK60_31185 [Paenibacillus odorifer]|nr:hypothetical protein BSK60_31185 [Paenibacillus odorifer]